MKSNWLDKAVTAMAVIVAVLLALVIVGEIFTLAAEASIHPVDSKKSGPIEADCMKLTQQVQAVINSLPHPAAWDYVVYCNDVKWNDALRSADDVGKTDWAFTDRKGHKTYIRATMFRRELPLGLSPEFIIAHELGHILLGTDDEQAANAWAREQLALLKK
jgi:hypothetical protein